MAEPVAVVGMQVHGQVMHVHPDPGLAQAGEHCRPIHSFGQLDHIEMVGMQGFRPQGQGPRTRNPRPAAGHRARPRPGGVPGTPGVCASWLTAQGALDVRDPVVVAELHHFVEPGPGLLPLAMVRGDAEAPELAHGRCVLRIVRDDHAALARGHVLDRVEAEHGQVRQGPHPRAGELRAQGVAAIGHQGQAVPLRDLAQAGVVARLARVVHGDDRLGARG